MEELASTSRVIIRIAAETQFGKVPTTGNHRVIPANSESLTYGIDKTQSEEINPSRGVSDVIPTSASASGSISVELKASVYDSLIEAGLQGTWGTLPVAPIVGAVVTATEITATSGLPNLVPGQYFTLQATNGKNNGKLLRVDPASTPTSTRIKLDSALPGIADAAVNADAVVVSSRLRNGTTRRSFLVEKQFSDIGVFRAYTGMNVAGFTLNVAQGALTTGEFTFMGRAGLPKTTATKMPGTQQPTPEMRPMSGMTGSACYVWIDDKPLVGTYVSAVSLTLDNSLRMQNAMCSAGTDGVVGAVGIGNGQLVVSGSLTLYMSSEDTLYEEFVKNRNVKLGFTAFDTEGNGYVFTLPKVNIGTHETPTPGNNQDVMATINFTGLQINSAVPAMDGVVLLVDRVLAPTL